MNHNRCEDNYFFFIRLYPMTKIVMITDHAQVGGVARYMVNLANGFHLKGVEAELMFLLTGRTEMLSALHPDIPVRCLPMRYFKYPLKLMRGLCELTRYLKRTEMEAIIVAKPLPALLTAIACRLAGKHNKLLITVHEDCGAIRVFYAGLRRWVFHLIYKSVYRHAPHMVAVSHAAARQAAAYTGRPLSRIRTIYNPVITPELQVAVQERPEHPWLVQPSMPVVLAVGRLSPEKNLPLLFEAFARLRSRHACRLIVLGEGEERAYLEALAQTLSIRNDVSLPGFQVNPYAYMAHCRMLVLTSYHEALSSVLIEALACGCPAIAVSNIKSASEILEGGRYGTLVPPGDAEALAAAMEVQLMSEQQPLSSKPHVEQYTQAVAVQHYLEFLKTMTQS